MLAARVLAREHVIYPRAVQWLVTGELQIEGGVVSHRRGVLAALALGAKPRLARDAATCGASDPLASLSGQLVTQLRDSR